MIATIAGKGGTGRFGVVGARQDSLVLLDAFADCIERGRYQPQELEAFSSVLAEGDSGKG